MAEFVGFPSLFNISLDLSHPPVLLENKKPRLIEPRRYSFEAEAKLLSLADRSQRLKVPMNIFVQGMNEFEHCFVLLLNGFRVSLSRPPVV